jgi:hypothetical protein
MTDKRITLKQLAVLSMSFMIALAIFNLTYVAFNSGSYESLRLMMILTAVQAWTVFALNVGCWVMARLEERSVQ